MHAAGCRIRSKALAMPAAGDHQTFPPVVLLVSAVGLLFYGLMGLALGFTGVVFSAGSATVTTVYLAVEFVLGWCVLLIHDSQRPFATYWLRLLSCSSKNDCTIAPLSTAHRALLCKFRIALQI